ncbi:hypothetical protein CBOM_04155 [Ceraceosorus bombacis]|uniref:Uncharacterized protein n=1 Tax=Ceraceosorus bombacis TaxID=401625 RepID=A0A0P1BLW5_9BASI|nr:hypothetical protein CBOM_04155 [Ceraceosorus bombacis]
MHESLVADARRSRRARPSRPEPDLRRLHSLVKTLGEWLSPLRELGEPLLDLSSATPDDQLAVARSTRALARAWRLLVRIHLSRHRARQAIVTSRKLIGLNVSAISDFTHGSDLVEIRKAQRSAVIAMLSQVLRFESRAQRLSYGVKVLRVAQEGITNGVWDVTSFEASSAVKRGVSGLGDARENDPRSDLLRIWARVLGALAVDEESAVPRGLEDVLLQSIRSLEARVITLLLSNGSDLKQGHAVDGPWARRMRAWRTKMRQIVFRDVGRLQRLLASSLQSSNVSSTPGLVNVRIEAGTVPMPTNDSSAVNDRLRRVMQTLRLLHPRAKDIALLELALQGLLLRSCKNADSLQRAFKDELQRWHSTSGSLEASSGHVTPTELAVEGHRASVSTQIRKISDGIEQQPIANALASDAVAVRQEESSWATDMTGWPSEDGCGQRHSALKNLEPKLDEDVHKADQSGRHRTLSHRRSPVSVPHSALSPWKRSLLDGGGSAVASPRLHSLNTVSNLVDASWKDHGGKGGRGQ